MSLACWTSRHIIKGIGANLMVLSINKTKLDNLASEIWKSAQRLRGKFKAYEYQSVILPIIVIRRLECVLIKWREERAAAVLVKRPELAKKEKDLAKLIKGLETSTAPFSNKTDWTLRKIYDEDPTLLEDNFRAYINGFSKNVDNIIEYFNYRATIGQMVKNNRLAPILNQYKELELGPDSLTPLEMATSTRSCSGDSQNRVARKLETTSPPVR